MKRAIKKFAVDLHIRVGYGTAFLLLLVSYFFMLYANTELLKQSHRINHSHTIMITIASLAIGILTGIYGFFTYSTENKARREADRRVFEYQEQLKERILELDNANKELIRMRSMEKFTATGRIAHTIAHEIRNPLTNINLSVDQLKADQLLKPGHRPEPGHPAEDADQAGAAGQTWAADESSVLLDVIDRNSLRINQLVTDLLNSTKFTDLSYKKMSINQVLDETLELARERIEANQITVTRNYSEDICAVSVDVEKIRVAFLNIIVNAVEAMEPGKGILQLATAGKGDKCVVTITDNGLGIDREAIPQLFDPYFTSKPHGPGLGLANTQNIILNHNGHISIDSEKGKGASFTITLDFA